ncbi:MAG: condensation domain-containing protein, partial [Bacteroidota bacterium]
QQFVKNESTLNESDAAYTFQLGRKHFTYRLPIVFENRDELMEKLSQAAASQTMQQAPLNEPSVIFLFPGQGAQYLQMGRQLYDSEPLFRDHLDQGLHWLKANTKIDFKQILYPEDEPVADINETRYAQPLIFIFEYALAQLVLSYGIRPQTMIGHSIGEYTAAVLSGVFQYEDALSLLVNRGQMMFDLPTGDMLSVALSEEEVQPFLMDGVDLAAANGPTQSVLSGPAESIAAVKARLDAADVLCKILRTSHAFHSSMLDPILEAYRQAVAAVKPQRPKVAFMSNLTGAMIDPERAADPDYWVQHMRQAVRFSKGAAALLEQFPKAVFIEVGPGRTLSGLLRQHRIDGKTPQAVNLIKTPKSKSDDLRFFTEALAKLWSQGVAIDWAAYHQHPRRRVSLPTYAFEPIKYPTLVDPFAMLIQSIKGKEANASKVDVSTLQEQEIFSMDESMDDFVIEKVERPNLSTSFRKAETQTEEALLQLCEAFFGLDKLGAEDDIFELGADSLKIMTLSKRIHKHFGLELPQQAYYEHSVIRDLAAIIDAKGQQTEERLDISTVPLSKSGYPLSTSQEKIWLSSQFKEGSITYNIPLPINLEGDYDVDCLSKAFDAVIERHESLRTVFRENAQGAARQWILSGAELGFSFRYEDLRSREEAVRLAARAIEADAFQVFDLQNGPLLRACLFHLKEQQFLLFVNIHHIISDDWSLEVLSNEVLAHYHFFKEGTPLQVPELKIQYKDFASWQLVQLKGEAFQKLETYWLNKLSEPLPLLDLPGHKKRPIVKTFNGYSIENYFSVEDSQTLKTFCTAQKGSLFMGMLAAWYVLFYKYTGQKDFVIGSPVSGRTHTDLENQIGCYFNTLAIRMQINPEENFTDFFQRVKQSVLEDYNHQAYPFEELLEHFKLNSDLSRNPVFDLMFSFHNTMEYKVEESERNPDQFKGTAENAKLDILLNAAEHGPNLYLYINYNTDLYEQSTMERLVLDYKRLLKKLLEQPKQALKKVDYQLELAQDLRAKNKSRLNKMKNKIK